MIVLMINKNLDEDDRHDIRINGTISVTCKSECTTPEIAVQILSTIHCELQKQLDVKIPLGLVEAMEMIL